MSRIGSFQNMVNEAQKKKQAQMAARPGTENPYRQAAQQQYATSQNALRALGPEPPRVVSGPEGDTDNPAWAAWGQQRMQVPQATAAPSVGMSQDELAKAWDLRQQRNIDYEQGLERGQKEFGQGMLGRIDAARSQEVGDILQQYKNLSQGSGASYDPLIQRSQNIMQQGYSAPELAALRESRLRNVLRAQQEQQRALAGRQAQMGLRGGVAGAQYSDLLGAQGRDRLQAEQELMLQQVARQDQAAKELQGLFGTKQAAQQAGLGAYSQALGGARADELARQQYNIAQQNKEALGRLSTGLAEMGLGGAERGSVISGEASRAAAEAMRQSGGGSKK